MTPTVEEIVKGLSEAIRENIARLCAEDCVNDWNFCEDAPEDAYDRAVADQTPFFRPLADKIIDAVRTYLESMGDGR